jgi:hypothetical protein
MGAAFVTPFDFRPSLTGSGTSYTVPSGKYARVVISNNTTVTINGNTLSAVFSESVAIWLKATDSISVSGGSLIYNEYNSIQ